MKVVAATLLEPVDLALTGRLNGAALAAEFSPFLFNLDAARAYIEALHG